MASAVSEPIHRRPSRREQSTNEQRAIHRHSLWLEDCTSKPLQATTEDLSAFEKVDGWLPNPPVRDWSPSFLRDWSPLAMTRNRSVSKLLNRIRARSASTDRRSHSSYDEFDRSSELMGVESIEMNHIARFVIGKRSKVKDQGHKFIAVILRTPTWCDFCSRPVLGVLRHFLVCRQCSFTCHQDCRLRVTLFCPQVLDRFAKNRQIFLQETSLTNDDSGSETFLTGDVCVGLTRQELECKVNEFNCNNLGLIIELASDSNAFKGFIRVYINLCRPITMCVTARPPSLLDVMSQSCELLPQSADSGRQCSSLNHTREGMGEVVGEEEDGASLHYTARVTSSFYLPPDTSKTVHISDCTTAQEVISMLLDKFRITDNPRKFALYERGTVGKKHQMRRLRDDELPLVLCLHWASLGMSHLQTNRFVLKEDYSGEIVWEAFSVPELESFLAILRREEDEYLERLKSKYNLMRIQIRRRFSELQDRDPVPPRLCDGMRDSASRSGSTKVVDVELSVV